MVADCWKLQTKQKAEGTAEVENDTECQTEEQDQECSEVSGIYYVGQKARNPKNQ